MPSEGCVFWGQGQEARDSHTCACASHHEVPTVHDDNYEGVWSRVLQSECAHLHSIHQTLALAPFSHALSRLGMQA